MVTRAPGGAPVTSTPSGLSTEEPARPGRSSTRGQTCSRDATAEATRSIASATGTPLSWCPSR